MDNKELPSGCKNCQSTLPCADTCGADPFVEREKQIEKPQVFTSNSTQLLCCPWCGMVPVLKDKSDGSDQGGFYAYVCPKDSPCNNSRMVMGFFGTKSNAIKFWNTRAI